MTKTMLRVLALLSLTVALAAAAPPKPGWRSYLTYEFLERFDVRAALAAALAGHSDAKPAPDEAGYWYRLAMRLGHDPRYRHAIAKAINARGGYLDRKINARLLASEWKLADIPNLDAVTPALERGGEPDLKGFDQLRALGIKTVVNLRLEDHDEDALVRKLGMTPVWLPLPDTSAPTPEQVRQFVALVDQPGARVYVHCSAGIFRTSTMVAAFRILHGMPLQGALAEARAHKFDGAWLNADLEVAFLTRLAEAHPARGSKRSPDR